MTSARDQNIIKTILKWVYYAKRPLRVVEIYHILAIKPGNNSSKRLLNNVESNADLGLEPFIDRSSGLLTIREESQIVSVAHPTVQEYLKTQESTLLSAAEEEISGRCLTYLLLDAFADNSYGSHKLIGYRLPSFPFVGYASTFWGDHLRGKPEENTALQDLALDFLKNERLLSISVQVASISTSSIRSYSMYFKKFPGVTVAATFGLVSLVDRLLGDGADIEETGHDGMTALYRASEIGCEPVVTLLLNKGANINAQGGQENNALQAASSRGHDRVVKLLLERGANVNAKGPAYFKSALHAASDGGHVQVVTTLLNEGAEPDAADGEEHGPLHKAAANGHTAVVKILLDKGASINAPSPWFGNALCTASLGGHIEVVKLLLKNKAPKVEINMEGGPEFDALRAASALGHEAVARLLIKNGANVNGNQTLEMAALGGHIAIVKLLLQNGADVNEQSDFHNNPLQAAADKGHKEIVALLLEKGATANLDDEHWVSLRARRRWMMNDPTMGLIASHPRD